MKGKGYDEDCGSSSAKQFAIRNIRSAKRNISPKKRAKTVTSAEKSRNICTWRIGWPKKWLKIVLDSLCRKRQPVPHESRMKEEKSPLAIRTNPKKFQFVGHGLEAVFGGDSFFNFSEKTFLNLHDLRAFGADQMMMMAVIVFPNQFKARRAVAKIKPLDHAHFLQQVHGAINGGEVATAFGHFGKNFPVGQRMRMPPQNFQYGRARAGDFPRLSAQPAGQGGQILPFVRM